MPQTAGYKQTIGCDRIDSAMLLRCRATKYKVIEIIHHTTWHGGKDHHNNNNNR